MTNLDDIDEELRRMCASMANAGVDMDPCDPDEWRPWRPAFPDYRAPEGGTWFARMRWHLDRLQLRANRERRFWCRLALWRIRRWV